MQRKAGEKFVTVFIAGLLGAAAEVASAATSAAAAGAAHQHATRAASNDECIRADADTNKPRQEETDGMNMELPG
ncbi:MAG: hypothetical protein WC073_06590 [Sterolibacterium sp.]